MSSRPNVEVPSREILRLLFEIAQFGAASCVALAEKAYRKYSLEQPKIDEEAYKHLAYYAKSRQYLVERHGNLVLSDKGLQRLEKLRLENMNVPDRWDGQWRIIIFDIPETKRLARDALRRLVKRLGFMYLQDSVWLYPHDCSEQIKLIQETYGVGNNIRLIVARTIDDQDQFEEYFQSKGILKQKAARG